MGIQDWDQVAEEIGPRLYRYFKYKGAGDQASDLVQETLIRLISFSRKFDDSRGPLIAFALGIAQNIWRENNRRSKKHDSLEDYPDLLRDEDLHTQLEKQDQTEKLRLILRRLPSVQQDILYFYFDEEITTRQIASILDIPEGTIKSHLHRAKDSLKTILEKEWK